MRILRKASFKSVLLPVMAAVAVAACGGGNSESTVAVLPIPVVSVDLVADASKSVATSIGATVIAGASSDEEVFNMAADIGDSWQLILNNKTGTYTIKVLISQYGLTSTTAASFTKTTSGAIVTIKDATGKALLVQIDTRTRTAGGRVLLGGKVATVAGTGYVVNDTTKLAGNYSYLGATRNASNGIFRDNPIGSLIVAANGTDVTVCDQGIVVNGACAAIPGSGIPVVPGRLLKLSKDAATGLIRIKVDARDFGALHVSAGDRGPVLILDRFGFNDENVLRTGVILAAKSAKLAGMEFNGNFICSTLGTDTGDIVVANTSFSVKDLVSNTNNTETLLYNKAVSSIGVALDLDGVAIAQFKNETLAQASLVLPLSSSLAVAAALGDGTLDICRRAS